MEISPLLQFPYPPRFKSSAPHSPLFPLLPLFYRVFCASIYFLLVVRDSCTLGSERSSVSEGVFLMERDVIHIHMLLCHLVSLSFWMERTFYKSKKLTFATGDLSCSIFSSLFFSNFNFFILKKISQLKKKKELHIHFCYITRNCAVVSRNPWKPTKHLCNYQL